MKIALKKSWLAATEPEKLAKVLEGIRALSPELSEGAAKIIWEYHQQLTLTMQFNQHFGELVHVMLEQMREELHDTASDNLVLMANAIHSEICELEDVELKNKTDKNERLM